MHHADQFSSLLLKFFFYGTTVTHDKEDDENICKEFLTTSIHYNHNEESSLYAL